MARNHPDEYLGSECEECLCLNIDCVPGKRKGLLYKCMVLMTS